MNGFERVAPQEKTLVRGKKARKLLDREMSRARKRGHSIELEIDFKPWVKPFVVVAAIYYKVAGFLRIPNDPERAARFVVDHGVVSVGIDRKKRAAA